MNQSPNHALQRTATAVTARASAAALPPAMHGPRQPPPSLSLGSLGHLASVLADRFEMMSYRLVSSSLARAWSSGEQVRRVSFYERFILPSYFEL
jgi:hypothetical protein